MSSYSCNYFCPCVSFRWHNHAGVHWHLAVAVAVTNSTTTWAETMADSHRHDHHSMHHPVYYHARDTTDAMVTGPHTSLCSSVV